ncbi:TIGR02588 family protein [Pleurocapsales cyanobacterium LEGE 06147]|nr:TIGR02588 family protein [Pleurocapsales cyanobacterium LEGE 06147]
MSQLNRQSNLSKQPQQRERSLAEWVTFAISLIVLLSIVVLVFSSWLKVGERPPVLVLERSGEVRQIEGKFYVPFTVTNSGGETANTVQAIAQLRINGEVKETGEQQFDFLAGGEAEEGEFIFSHNPQDGELVLRVASYQKP